VAGRGKSVGDSCWKGEQGKRGGKKQIDGEGGSHLSEGGPDPYKRGRG